jgi:hypothetical protein
VEYKAAPLAVDKSIAHLSATEQVGLLVLVPLWLKNATPLAVGMRTLTMPDVDELAKAALDISTEKTARIVGPIFIAKSPSVFRLARYGSQCACRNQRSTPPPPEDVSLQASKISPTSIMVHYGGRLRRSHWL